MKKFYDVLSRYVSENQPNFSSGDSVLTMLYEAYSDCNQTEDDQTKNTPMEPFGTIGAFRWIWIGQILDYLLSLGRTMFSTMASSAAGTMPEPPKM